MFGKSLIRRDRNEQRELASPFTHLQREMNRLFEDFFGDRWGLEPYSGWGRLEGFRPSVNVSETDKEVRVTAELPGVEEKDIDVTVTRNALTIKGEKHTEHEEKSESHYHVERSFGSFERTVPLPAEVVTDKVDARFSKGVLTISMPKTETAQAEARRVKIKTG
jgi:HSP20 family protein